MEKIKIPSGIKPEEFFNEFLPKAFDASKGDMDLSGYKGINFTMGFDITGASGGTYTISLMDGDKLKVTEGEQADAIMSIEMPEKVFTDGLSGRIPGFPIEGFLSNPQEIITGLPPEEAKQRIDNLNGINGMMELEAHNGDETIEMGVKFNGKSDPCCRIIGEMDNLMSIMTGQTNPVQGFMSGKYKITGSLPFAMSLQKVMPS
ncbi:MAG: SCP2 sterol-binding domain-containing protein [Thermodesulfobacteriota bacterium]|nr:SCP2 sterol-binding domain-containing protein [Thermodesulfobacteriota bacterium]